MRASKPNTEQPMQHLFILSAFLALALAQVPGLDAYAYKMQVTNFATVPGHPTFSPFNLTVTESYLRLAGEDFVTLTEELRINDEFSTVAQEFSISLVSNKNGQRDEITWKPESQPKCTRTNDPTLIDPKCLNEYTQTSENTFEASCPRNAQGVVFKQSFVLRDGVLESKRVVIVESNPNGEMGGATYVMDFVVTEVLPNPILSDFVLPQCSDVDENAPEEESGRCDERLAILRDEQNAEILKWKKRAKKLFIRAKKYHRKIASLERQLDASDPHPNQNPERKSWPWGKQ